MYLLLCECARMTGVAIGARLYNATYSYMLANKSVFAEW